MSIDDIKALAALGATEVTIHPDGRIVAKFEKPSAPQVQYVPVPHVCPQPYVNPYTWPYGVWYGTTAPALGYFGDEREFKAPAQFSTGGGS